MASCCCIIVLSLGYLFKIFKFVFEHISFCCFSDRLKKLEEEFYLYVSPKEVAEALEIDEMIIDFIYNYWVIKRKVSYNIAASLQELVKAFIHSFWVFL